MINDYGAELYQRYLDGDEKAFEEIVLIYREGLTFFINRFLNNVDNSEDIAADVFAYLIFKPKKYNFKVSLKTYLYMLGRSRALDFIRKETRMRNIPYETLNHELKDESQLLEDRVIAKEEAKRLYDALKKLPDDYRTAMYLVYFEELKYEEAAIVMDKNKKQIENLVYRAKASLKNILKEDK